MARLPSISKLNLRECDQIVGGGLGWLSELTSLRSLTLSGCASLISLPSELVELADMGCTFDVDSCANLRGVPDGLTASVSGRLISLSGDAKVPQEVVIVV